MSLVETTYVSIECVDHISDDRNLDGRIAAKAYEYFLERGCNNGRDLDDWLRAEQALVFRPAVQLRREDSDFVIRIDMPGLHSADLQIRVSPQHILVISEPFEGRQIFRVVPFPVAVVPAAVEAAFDDGMLRIVAPIAICD
jgi:HSP20 family molecular chaperone IbpA